MRPSHRPWRTHLILFASIIVLPALVLSFLSWRSLRQEEVERREEVRRRSLGYLKRALETFEKELETRKEENWRAAGDDPLAFARERGFPIVRRTPEGAVVYPSHRTEGPFALEERLEREDPDLLNLYTQGMVLEFDQHRPKEAMGLYALAHEQSDVPANQAALLLARTRAASAAGRMAEAEEFLGQLETAWGDLQSLSGIPYQILAAQRRLEMNPTGQAAEKLTSLVTRSSLEGHLRVALLRDGLRRSIPDEVRAPLLDALTQAQALEQLETRCSTPGPPQEDVLLIADRAFLISFRPDDSPTTAIAFRLDPFPPPAAAERLRESIVDGLDLRVAAPSEPPSEALATASSRRYPSLRLLATVRDASILRSSPGRVWFSAGLVLCLLGALLFGVLSILRSLNQQWNLAQAKSDFVSGVSHELKTPLTSIRMLSEMLDRGMTTAPEKEKEYHRLIHRESVRLSRLVENVLDFTRIEEGRKSFQFAPHDLNEICRSVGQTFQAQIEGQDLRFRVDVPEERLIAPVDPDAIEGALLNLLDNAVKYAAQGGEIALRLLRDPDQARVEVSDRGPGISPDEKDRIFERFYRGREAQKGSAGGSGLGLFLVRHVALAHRGRAFVEENPSGGSTFALTIPFSS